MSAELLTAIVAVIAVVLTAVSTRYGRVRALEQRLDSVEATNRDLWLYCRTLIDHIYRGKGLPLPDPPEGLFT